MIILNSLFPVIVLIALGFALKRSGVTDDDFLQKSDRLVYYIFFPTMLFWKIGGATYSSSMSWNYCLAALLTIMGMFFISFLIIYFVGISNYSAGSFAQSCYRHNTYIGVAVVLNATGAEGIHYFGLLIALVIPVLNVISVITLIWFGQEKLLLKKRLMTLLRALISNPLIIGCLAGLAYSRSFAHFPGFIDNSLALLSMLTLPLALLSIGGALSFAGLRRHFKLSLLASFAKLVVFPILGFVLLRLLGVEGTSFVVTMIYFSLPASTAIYILSSQMGSDPELASASIAISTVLSFPVLSAVLLL